MQSIILLFFPMIHFYRTLLPKFLLFDVGFIQIVEHKRTQSQNSRINQIIYTFFFRNVFGSIFPCQEPRCSRTSVQWDPRCHWPKWWKPAFGLQYNPVSALPWPGILSPFLLLNGLDNKLIHINFCLGFLFLWPLFLAKEAIKRYIEARLIVVHGSSIQGQML